MKKTLPACWPCCSLASVATLARTPKPKTVKIALIAKSEANFVFLSARRGAEAKAAALSRQLGATISVSWLTPPREDAAQQAELIRRAVKEHANAILLSASDGAGARRRPSTRPWTTASR